MSHKNLIRSEVDTEQASASVSERVCLVKGAMKAVPKNGYNSHGKYKFASVDDVYNAVRPLLAEHQLDLKLDILETDVRASAKGTPWLYLKAAIGFEGETPQHRFMALPVTGAQTYEIACSYLQKQFLRARLQLETGEYEEQEMTKDNPPANGTPPEVDGMFPATMDEPPAVKTAPAMTEADHFAKPAPLLMADGTTVPAGDVEWCKTFSAMLQDLPDVGTLDSLVADNAAIIDELAERVPSFHERLQLRIDERRMALADGDNPLTGG